MAKQPPRYAQIAAVLRARIQQGELQPGQALPGENTLMKDFDTSRGTVRAALAILRDEGLTDTRRGAGVFVRKFRPIRRNAQKRLSERTWGRGRSIWDSDVEDRGYETLDAEVIRTGEVPDQIAGCFGLDSDETVCRRYRVYATEGRRLMMSTSYLPWDLVAGSQITELDTGAGGTYARLADLGHAPVRFREEIKVRTPTTEEAKALTLTPSTPVVSIARTAFDADDEPVEVNEMVLDSTAYILEYDFSA